MVSSTTSMVGNILDDVLTELRGLPDETLTALEGKVKEGLFSVQPFEGLEKLTFRRSTIGSNSSCGKFIRYDYDT